MWRREATRPALPLVVRPRLIGRVAERFSRRLTVLRAGPGFGKSTLLWQMIDENRLMPEGEDRFWRCTSDDATPEGFARALCLTNGLRPVADPGAAVRSVAADIWAHAPDHIVLVFDDAHLLWPDGAPNNALAQLLEVLPS